ncbi:aspartate carbamoyltransferase [Anaeromicrobium sediminis]|uniref:Aspartate carbamoyltransferase n=1 Tax=Anaeromicrobium sediminis TaxID=1478221 RepID=A0A267MB70_9FIRM|nr:aspartate carbamoyltransferase [Anaeromicrobium sediminis]PAB56168.1 aspartate carbamoyltransferase [Anaeromicrobium sediminis]
MKYLIEPNDLTLNETERILSLAQSIMKEPRKFAQVCRGKLMANLFYEPSTRTRFSFEAAMLRLGGNVMNLSDISTSSHTKGESMEDTIKTISSYSDLIVMRHPKAGTPKKSIPHSFVPIINAGDGPNHHPTQTLTDLLTIKDIKGHISNQTVAFCGDLLYGRTVHSLVKALSRYDNIKFIFISPKELKIPDYIKEYLDENSYVETQSLEAVMDQIDVLYVTRVQGERFENIEEYNRLKDIYIIDPKKLENAKEDMIIMHPLPRVNEIDTRVDEDKRAVYFNQVRYGMYVRMALIADFVGDEAC